MGGKGQSHRKKVEKFKKAHPEGRTEFAKVKRAQRNVKRKARLAKRKDKKHE